MYVYPVVFLLCSYSNQIVDIQKMDKNTLTIPKSPFPDLCEQSLPRDKLAGGNPLHRAYGLQITHFARGAIALPMIGAAFRRSRILNVSGGVGNVDRPPSMARYSAFRAGVMTKSTSPRYHLHALLTDRMKASRVSMVAICCRMCVIPTPHHMLA